MTKEEKIRARLMARPTPANIKWGELQVFLGHLGFDLKKGAGSRRKFVHRESLLIINCHEPHPSPLVSKWLIEQVLDKLRENGML